MWTSWQTTRRFPLSEVMGGIEPAKSFITKMLEAGKTVVTANKELIAKHWPELEKVAKEHNVGLYFEASVGGGIPILRAVSDSLQANTITSVLGIINGTTNYILTKMCDEGGDFEEVLRKPSGWLCRGQPHQRCGWV